MFRKLFRRGALACALLAAPLAAHAQTPQPELVTPSAADFGALPLISHPKLSPDGTHIAAEGLIDGRTLVVVVDLTTPQRRITNLNLPPKFQFEWLRWAGNDRVLFSISQADTLDGEDVRVTRMVAYDFKSGKQFGVGPSEQGVDGDDLVYVDPAGAFLILSTQPSIYVYPSVYRVDLITGKSKQLLGPRDNVWNWYADTSGAIRVGLGSNEGRWWTFYRPGADGDFKRLVRREGDKDDQGIQQFTPIAGSDLGYAVADGKTGHFALYRFNFATGELGDLIYENPDYDVDDYALGPKGDLLGIYYTSDRDQVQWIDPELKHLQERLDRALPDASDWIISISDDHKRFLVLSESATNPGDYYIYDRTTNHLDAFAQRYPAVTGKRLAPMEPVRYQARDGLEVPGYLTLPPGKGDKNLPLVIMPHGGPYARDEWGYDGWVQFLASKGYAVLQPNFRGSTGFGRKYVEAGTGAWGRGMQDDIDDGVKWLAKRGTIDPKRVCIMGASFGGYAAEWAAVRNPELYRCAISFAGVSDVSSQLRFNRKSFSAPRYFRDWRARVQGDRSFDLDQISPLKSADRMTVPILIAHGDADNTVPVSQSRRLHDALVKLGRQHEYVIYPGEAHGFKDPAHATDFLNRVGAFLDRYNPAQP